MSPSKTPGEAASPPLFFGGLTELRAIAALAVVVTHTEYVRASWQLHSLHSYATVANLGTHGVMLFFGLSGFLITALLRVELERTGEVDVRRFYLRRALRIRPLYFFTLAIGLAAAPQFLPNLGFRSVTDLLPTAYPWLLAFMLPNVALVRHGSMLGLSVLWSVGVEEQFYAVWPWIVRRFRIRLPTLLVSLVVVATVTRCIFALALPPEPVSGAFRPLLALARLFPIESLAAGALLALFRDNPRLAAAARHTASTILLALVAPAWLAMADPYHPLFHLGSALLWSALLGLVMHRGAMSGPAGSVLRRVGEVSYGVYLYHTFIVAAALLLLRSLGLHDGPLHHLITYLLVVSGTVMVSLGSYRWMELPFLRLKERFAVVRSRA